MLQRYAKQIRYIAVIIIVGGIIVGFVSSQMASKKEAPILTEKSTTSNSLSGDKAINTGETLNFVSPKTINQNATLSLIGTVISNETADIYARRNGILKDIYVDIGDTIKEGQVIGIMLPPGVQGESNASIFEKQVKVQEAKDNLEHTKNVAMNIIEKAKLDLEQRGLKKDVYTPATQSLEKMKKDIDLAEENLEKLLTTNQATINSLDSDTQQSLEQGIVLVDASLEKMEHAMLGESHTNGVFSEVYLDKVYGATDVTTRYEAIDNYRKVYFGYESYVTQGGNDITKLLTLLDQTSLALSHVVDMLGASLTSSTVTQSSLAEKKTSLLTQQTTVLQKKETIEDLYNSYNKTIAIQDQQVVATQNTIDSMKEQLKQMVAKFEAEYDILGSDLDKAGQDFSLTKAQQELIIKQKENMVQITQAQLQQEFAKNGNDNIISPFSGIVSKRRVRVGDLVSMSNPLFELVDVKTTLAEKAKREVQFGIPEEYHDVLSIGDIIEFSLTDNDTLVYTAAISRISPQIDDITQTITVQAKLDDTLKIPHNTRTNVIVELTENKQYQIPSSAIEYLSGDSYIYAYDDTNKDLHQIEITVIADDGEFADIQGNISTTTKILEQAGVR